MESSRTKEDSFQDGEMLLISLNISLMASMKPMMAKNQTGMESSRTKEDFFQDGEMWLISLYPSLQAAMKPVMAKNKNRTGIV